MSNLLPNAFKAMLALISRNPQITYDQLAKELNISRETVRRHIDKLRDDYKAIPTLCLTYPIAVLWFVLMP